MSTKIYRDSKEMKTSCFFTYKGKEGVSIAAKAPEWYKGRTYRALYPNYWFFKKYKDDGDEAAYEAAYRAEVLSKLDPAEVYEDLKDSVLLCWEKAGKFCHRRIVAKWLEENLGVTIEEI